MYVWNVTSGFIAGKKLLRVYQLVSRCYGASRTFTPPLLLTDLRPDMSTADVQRRRPPCRRPGTEEEEEEEGGGGEGRLLKGSSQ